MSWEAGKSPCQERTKMAALSLIWWVWAWRLPTCTYEICKHCLFAIFALGHPRMYFVRLVKLWFLHFRDWPFQLYNLMILWETLLCSWELAWWSQVTNAHCNDAACTENWSFELRPLCMRYSNGRGTNRLWPIPMEGIWLQDWCGALSAFLDCWAPDLMAKCQIRPKTYQPHPIRRLSRSACFFPIAADHCGHLFLYVSLS